MLLRVYRIAFAALLTLAALTSRAVIPCLNLVFRLTAYWASFPCLFCHLPHVYIIPLNAFFGHSLVSHWNAWFDSLVYANKPDLVVLQTVVRRLIDVGEETAAAGESMTAAESTTETIRAATVMIATAPILAGYPFIQKYLVKGTMVGAVKG